ncbi:MAG: endonuclease [Desulfovibrionaceae bacterium]|nr:endonuclease [Desulfovibrionaceae bacterium]
MEHAVPTENFGRAFVEWREGHPQCIDRHGKPFKGRNCAQKVNLEYRRMQADMYNLFPAIGAVNAERSNFNYAELPDQPNAFGSCPMKIADRKAEPPQWAKGELARAALYLDWAYAPLYRLSKQQKQLFLAWHKQYKVSEWVS